MITLVLLVVALELRHELEGMAGGITTGVILHWLPPPVYGERRRPEPPAGT